MKILSFIKKEIVLIISLLLAVLSMLFVPPDKGYIDYVDFSTLALLFSLMIVMAGVNKLGLFKFLAEKLLNKARSITGVIFTLVLLCFFSSMIITNDVALITFVPFSIVTLKLANQRKKLIYAVTLETVAANMGSMLTPIGNPQNLYLFSSFNLTLYDFLHTIFPYAALSLVALIILSLIGKREEIVPQKSEEILKPDIKPAIMYFILFLLSLLCVFRILNYILLIVVVITVVLIFDRKVFLKVDYSLLLTFLFLFVFIGNLGSIPEISYWLRNIVEDNEVITGVLSSQIFSDVPATILLSKFTNNITALLIGVNLGGLGTLIASMASLISFKFIQKENISNVRYLIVFTLINVLLLALNFLLFYII